MLNLLSPNSPLGRWLAFLLDAILIGLAWAICSLPVVTMGAANAALCRVALNWMRTRDGCTLTDFFRAFRGNFRKATAIWLVLLPLLALLLLNGYLVWFTELQLPAFLQWMFFVEAAVWMAWADYSFMLQAVFENTVGRTLGNAIRFVAGNLATTVLLLVIECAAIFLSLLLPYLTWIIFPGAAFLSARFYWNTFLPWIPRDLLKQPVEEDGADPEN